MKDYYAGNSGGNDKRFNKSFFTAVSELLCSDETIIFGDETPDEVIGPFVYKYVPGELKVLTRMVLPVSGEMRTGH